jgi:hypothetical protein
VPGQAAYHRARGVIMQSQSKRLCAYALAGTAVAVVLGLSAPSTKAQAALFAGLAGGWAGDGRIDLQDGTSERVRCRADYSVGGGGSSFQQHLRCASDSYKLDLNSNVQSNGGSLSGTWSAQTATRNLSGSVSGNATASRIEAKVSGSVFSAGVNVYMNGDQQGVDHRTARHRGEGHHHLDGQGQKLARRNCRADCLGKLLALVERHHVVGRGVMMVSINAASFFNASAVSRRGL